MPDVGLMTELARQIAAAWGYVLISAVGVVAVTALLALAERQRPSGHESNNRP